MDFEIGIFVGAAGMLAFVTLVSLVWHTVDLIREWWQRRRPEPRTIQPKGLELIDMEIGEDLWQKN